MGRTLPTVSRVPGKLANSGCLGFRADIIFGKALMRLLRLFKTSNPSCPMLGSVLVNTHNCGADED
ncbi:polyketide synthase [Aspergillus luchuensis]|uniref:Polyketide synthase n=1 Tax=Aspergillus kawachii TaxID=1069201 RepID=A0A146F0V7_ASPKA|nr:polyketide synthase [Aspergillus luchuensis]